MKIHNSALAVTYDNIFQLDFQLLSFIISQHFDIIKISPGTLFRVAILVCTALQEM